MTKNYESGVVDGVALWAEACGKTQCSECPINQIGAGTRCQDYIAKFPAKAVNILKEMKGLPHTYYEEYMSRFPACDLTVEALSLLICRKAVYEGYLDCPHGSEEKNEEACLACWKEAYKGDAVER